MIFGGVQGELCQRFKADDRPGAVAVWEQASGQVRVDAGLGRRCARPSPMDVGGAYASLSALGGHQVGGARAGVVVRTSAGTWKRASLEACHSGAVKHSARRHMYSPYASGPTLRRCISVEGGSCVSD